MRTPCLTLLFVCIAVSLPVSPALAQASKRAQPVIQAVPNVKLSTLQQMDPSRWQRMHQLHEARAAAEVADIVGALRDGMVGKQPGLTDNGGLTDRTTGRASDRLGAAKPGQAPGYQDPLGNHNAGINSRLRGTPPRSTVVGPGGIPTNRTGLAASSSTESIVGHGVRTTTTTFRSDRTGATFLIYSVSYDSASGRLVGWSATAVDGYGDSRTQLNHVDYRGPNGDVPVVTTTVSQRAGDAGAHTGGTESSGTVTRPLMPTDPPVQDPVVAKRPTSGQPIAEEGTPVQLPVMPWGIQCNPITGFCTEGMKLGNNQVNPGPAGASNSAGSGPRVNVDPKTLVINPNPVYPQGQGSPRPIDRDGATPGARPPPPPEGDD